MHQGTGILALHVLGKTLNIANIYRDIFLFFVLFLLVLFKPYYYYY